MKRSPPGDFQIRGQAKRVQPEPLSPTSTRSSENGYHLDNVAARIHNSTSDPVSLKDLDHSRGSRGTQFSTQSWSNHDSSLTWRRSSTEEAASERIRRVGYDSTCCDCTINIPCDFLMIELYFVGYRPSESSPPNDTSSRDGECMCTSQPRPV